MQKMEVRRRQKAALQDRKSAASQNRMKNVASLAVDIPAPRKRRKGNEGEPAPSAPSLRPPLCSY